MGSLPNLNELGKTKSRSVHCFRTGLPIEYCHLYGAGHSSFFQEDLRVKISHKHSMQDRLLRVKSNGHGSRNMYDDFAVEQHMASYSPISNRSMRNLSTIIRRKDSLNSSIGANSVRRLIGAVKNVHHHRCNPLYTRRTLIRNVVLLCLLQLLTTVAFLPFLTLQGSISLWTISSGNRAGMTASAGSFLIMSVFVMSALVTLISPVIIHVLGTKVIFLTSYSVFCLFYTVHIYPNMFSMIPSYLLLGTVLGPLHLCHVSFLLTLSTKISYTLPDEDEETKSCKKTIVIRRMARVYRAAQDFGLIIGSTIAALFLAFSDVNPQIRVGTLLTENVFQNSNYTAWNNDSRNSSIEETISISSAEVVYNSIFQVDEIGERICGISSCPSSWHIVRTNETASYCFSLLSRSTVLILTCLFSSLSALAVLITAVGIDKIRGYLCQDPIEHLGMFTAMQSVVDSFKDSKMQLAAPLAFFIGLEQAFMYADFSKSYVICTIGIQRVNVIFISMGLLQSIAACTLSMLLRTIKRYYVVAVGFTFHACLLMVVMLWKPMSDDPALFYVISAAWGVCNAIWEMLNFTLLTGLYSDNWEGPFANTIFFKFLGLAFAFGAHDLLCNWVKLYILAFFLVLSVLSFGWLEIRLESIRKTKNVNRL